MQRFKIALCIVTASLWLVQTAHADDDDWFNQPRGFHMCLNSVVDIQNNGKDDDRVMLKGRLTNYLGKDNYEFTDVHGDRIEVELDDDADWSAVHRDQLITIAGSLDKNMFTVKVDAKHFLIASLQEQKAFQAATAASMAANQAKITPKQSEGSKVNLASSPARSAMPMSEPVQQNAYSTTPADKADASNSYQTDAVDSVQGVSTDNVNMQPADNGASVHTGQATWALPNTYIESTINSGITTNLVPTDYANQIMLLSPQATLTVEDFGLNPQPFTTDESGNSYLMLNSNVVYPPAAEIISVNTAPIVSKYSQNLYVSGSYSSVVSVPSSATTNSANQSLPQAQYMHSSNNVVPEANSVVFQPLDEAAATNTLQIPATPAADTNNLLQAIDNTILDIHSQMQQITSEKP